MSGFYPFEQKCGNLLIAQLPSEGEWLWLYASATVPKFGPNMNIEPLMHALRSMCKADELPVPIQPGHILGKVRVVNITKAHAKQKYPHIPLFPDVRQILHIVQRLVLPNALKVSGTGLPRFDRWPQLNQQQQSNLLFAELGMTPSSDDDAPPGVPEFQRPASDDDSKPPKAPEFSQNDSNDDSNDSDGPPPPIFKTPPPSKSGRTESPLEKHPRSQIIHTLSLTHTHTHLHTKVNTGCSPAGYSGGYPQAA
jgi:hypothetical protein